MTALSEFLLARIAEDEIRATTAIVRWMEQAYGAGTMEGDPDWVDEMIRMWIEPSREPTDSYWRSLPTGSDEDDVKAIAVEWSDHPDYREEWRQ